MATPSTAPKTGITAKEHAQKPDLAKESTRLLVPKGGSTNPETGGGWVADAKSLAVSSSKPCFLVETSSDWRRAGLVALYMAPR